MNMLLMNWKLQVIQLIVVQKSGFMGERDKVTVLEQKNEITSNLSSDSQTGKKSTFKQNLTELPCLLLLLLLLLLLFVRLFFVLFFVLQKPVLQICWVNF